MDRVKLKEAAKQRLKENRWPMVLMAFIASVISGVMSVSTGTTTSETGETVSQNPSFALILISIAFSLFVVNVVKVAACKFFRDNIRENQEVGVIAYPFKNDYMKNVGTMALVTVFTGIGCVLLIVPGIIIGMGLAAVPYLLTQKPELGAMDTVKLSWELMNGHKWEYFVLILSFLGWELLSVLTLGILGIFYVNPYLMQTEAGYFDELLAEA